MEGEAGYCVVLLPDVIIAIASKPVKKQHEIDILEVICLPFVPYHPL